jgi:hypothetical protein
MGAVAQFSKCPFPFLQSYGVEELRREFLSQPDVVVCKQEESAWHFMGGQTSIILHFHRREGKIMQVTYFSYLLFPSH